jgi:superfamily II DNA/RNA helicase
VQVTEVECLVIDEADIMISKQMDGFIEEVVQKFGMPTKEERQTMMFSATFPVEIQKMAIEYLYDHVWIGIGPVGGASSTVTQRVEQVEYEGKFERLLDQLYEFLEAHAGERLLVFCNTKVEAKGLDEKLWDKKVETGALHGDLNQAERESNLQKFRDGDIEVMVATDVAARGLDIGGVTHVINYDVPRDIDTYVQRIGRTGRIGHKGYATTYITMKDGKFLDDAYMLKAMTLKMEESKSSVPDWLAEAAIEGNKESWNTWDQHQQHDARDWAQQQDQPQQQDWSNWDQPQQQEVPETQDGGDPWSRGNDPWSNTEDSVSKISPTTNLTQQDSWSNWDKTQQHDAQETQAQSDWNQETKQQAGWSSWQ